MPVTVISNHCDEIAAKFAQGAAEATLQTAIYITNDVKKEMRKPKSGRGYAGAAITKSYKMGGRGYKKWKGSGAKMTFSGGRVNVTTGYKMHRASRPGEAPAVDTGNLINSIGAERVGQADAAAFSNSEYAVPLEFGTRKMAARPAWTPAAFRALDLLWKLMARAVRGG